MGMKGEGEVYGIRFPDCAYFSTPPHADPSSVSKEAEYSENRTFFKESKHYPFKLLYVLDRKVEIKYKDLQNKFV